MMPCSGFGRTNGMGGTAAMAITQALGSSVATAGFGATDERTRDRPPELLTVADPARGPPDDPVVLEQTRANGI
jgi:hypothetical protein